MNDERRKVLEMFRDEQTHEPWQDEPRIPQLYTENDECRLMVYDYMKKVTGIPKNALKPIIRELRNEGFIVLTPAVDLDEYRPNGSGYMLTKAGIAHINAVMPYTPTV